MRMTRPLRARVALFFILCAFFRAEKVSAQEVIHPMDYVAEVMRHHPALQRAEYRVESARFAVKASGLQPNPTLTLAATAGDPGESSNALTQSIEISGQPQLRWQLADLRFQTARLEQQSTQRVVAAQAYRSWLSCWKGSRLADLSSLRVRLMEDVLKAANRRYEVGEISQNEALRVELATAQAQADLAVAMADLEASRRELDLLLGRKIKFIAPDSLTNLLEDVDYQKVMDSVALNPEIVISRLRQKMFEVTALLVSKETAPSLSLSLYRADLFRTGSIEQGAQVSISWPVFDWGGIENRKRQQEAEAKAEGAEAQRALMDRRRDVSRLWSQLEAARKNRVILSEQATRYEELAREGRVAYDLGMISLTDALQTEAAFRAAGVDLVGAQTRVLELESQLLELTGLAWPGVTEDNTQ